MFLVSPYSFPPGTLMAAIERLGLTSNLQVCLDAGAAASYDGSSQTWTDLSGNGNHFYRGSGSGSDSADPTFNGTSGNQTSSEYFSYDGGDRFTLAAGSPPSWQSSIHKAGGKFSCVFWNYVNNISSGGPTQNFVGVGDVTSQPDAKSGFGFSGGATALHFSLSVYNEAGTLIGGTGSSVSVNNNAWNMIGLSMDITGGKVDFAANSSYETISVSFPSLSSTDSHNPLVIGAVAANGYLSLSTGCRQNAVAMWNDTRAQADFLAIYNATKSKFGL